MHKVFISHHHENDQGYKDELVRLGERKKWFVDRSVDTGDIPDEYSDEQARKAIRDDYLRDSTVTIVLVGTETYSRKHVDWEIHSSMYDGAVNKRSGVIVINLPTILNDSIIASRDGEKELYPDIQRWVSIGPREQLLREHPYMPCRIIDNLLAPDVWISVFSWDRVWKGDILKRLIDLAFRDRKSCKYDLSRPMQRANLRIAIPRSDCNSPPSG